MEGEDQERGEERRVDRDASECHVQMRLGRVEVLDVRGDCK